jgi:hypothetical protein
MMLVRSLTIRRFSYVQGEVAVFEFIGVCVVTYVVWCIAKRLIFGGISKTLSRAAIFAVGYNVPDSFAVNIIKNPRVMREALKVLKENKPAVSTLDVYEQYGLAIVMLYEGAKTEAGGGIMKRMMTPKVFRIQKR